MRSERIAELRERLARGLLLAESDTPDLAAELLAAHEYEKARADQHAADLTDAAGELLVPLPEPGSDLAKVISANRLLRTRVDELRGRLSESNSLLDRLDARLVERQRERDEARQALKWERERCDRLERERNAYERSAAMACEFPPDDCECPGCMLAAATGGTGVVDRPGGEHGE